MDANLRVGGHHVAPKKNPADESPHDGKKFIFQRRAQVDMPWKISSRWETWCPHPEPGHSETERDFQPSDNLQDEIGGWFSQTQPSTKQFTHATATACRELVDIQKRILIAVDPNGQASALDTAVQRADASVARIKELEQQLKATKAVASDAGSDKLIELLTELVANSKEANNRLEAIQNKAAPAACCIIS